VAAALEATVRIGILVLLVDWCFSIVRPFFIPIAWGVIIDHRRGVPGLAP
jgi:predicted PurR-regulated permease PerM